MQKRHMYAAILALALCLLVLVGGITVFQQAGVEPLEYIQFQEDVQGMRILPFYEEAEDTWYLFLPGYAQPEDIRVVVTAGVQAALPRLTLNENITVQVDTPFRSREYTLQIRHAANLPTLHLEAEAGTLDYLHSSLDHEKDVVATLTDAEGNTLLHQVATLSGRGNGTWGPEKRPYNLNFSNGVSFGDFRNADRLCLLAEFYDETKLRNSLVYHAAEQLDIPYGSAYQHCSLYVGGEYRGIYGITTKQEYTNYIDRDGIQAVFEYTSYPKENQFYAYPSLQPIRVLYGSMEQTKYIVDDFCQALQNQDWELCAQLADLDSFARKYAMDEFFTNYDLGFSSQYFYIDGDGIIHTMLPWDYDWSMGSSYMFYDLPPVQDIQIENFPDYWNAQLLQSSAFRQKVVEVLQEYYTEELFASLDSYLGTAIDAIADSLACDTLRWRGVPGLNLYGGDPDREYLLFLKDRYSRYYPQRRDFLSGFYSNREAFVQVYLQFGLPRFYLPKGTDLWEALGEYKIWDGGYLPQDIRGWRTADGRLPEEVGVIEQDITFEAIYGPGEQAAAAPEEPAAAPVLNQPWAKGLLAGATALVLVLLTAAECWQHRRKKEKVAV